jgi:hypothetical protein
MGTTLWKNLSTIPATEREELKDECDELGHVKSGQVQTDVVYVYFRRGGVVEVRPATGVQLNGDTLTVLNGMEVVARYPRERVMQATHQPVEPTPFC